MISKNQVIVEKRENQEFRNHEIFLPNIGFRNIARYCTSLLIAAKSVVSQTTMKSQIAQLVAELRHDHGD